MAVTLPVGVPSPWIQADIARPSRPSPWTSEVAGYYFVSASGTDTGRPYGTPSAPRQTIPQSLGPGAYIEISGSYGIGSGGAINFTGSGNGSAWVAGSAGPIWFVGDLANKPHLTTLDGFLRGSYLYLDGLYFDTTTLAVGTSSDGFPADHILVRNCEFVGTGLEVTNRTGVGAIGFSAASKVTQVIFYLNTMRNWGDIGSGSDVDACGIIIDTWCDNVWVLENTIHTCSGSGGRFGGAYEGTQSPFNTTDIYVGKNHAYNCRQSGFAVKLIDFAVFSENHCHDILGGPGGPGCGLFAQYAPLNVWWVNNLLHDQQYGILVASTNATVKNSDITADVPGVYYVYAVGNVIHDCLDEDASYDTSDFQEAGIRMYGGTFRHYVNNTIVHCASGVIAHGFAGGTGGGHFLQGNIISDVVETNGRHVWFVNEETNSTMTNCLLYQPAGAARIQFNGASRTLAQYQSLSGSGGGCLEGNPLFANVGANDFNLTDPSPAVETGVLSAVYATYLADVGQTIAIDIEGTSRPQGSSWDMGAIELADDELNITTLNATTLTVG